MNKRKCRNIKKTKKKEEKNYLKCSRNCAVNEEINGGIHHHEETGEKVQLVVIHGWDISDAVLDTVEDDVGVVHLDAGGHDPGRI